MQTTAKRRPPGLMAALAEADSELRVEWRNGSYYVLGGGIEPIPVDSKAEGLREIIDIKGGK